MIRILKPLRLCSITAILALLAAQPVATAKTTIPVGLWRTEDGEGVVQLYECGNNLCGRLYSFKPSTKPEGDRDSHNPDPALRGRPLCGLEFMGGFKAQTDGSYDHGWIYSPRHGANFSASLKLIAPDQLALRGYLLIPALGETQNWSRVTEAQACNTNNTPVE
jgi:uncharacterized protein (DUF2147 family)